MGTRRPCFRSSVGSAGGTVTCGAPGRDARAPADGHSELTLLNGDAVGQVARYAQARTKECKQQKATAKSCDRWRREARLDATQWETTREHASVRDERWQWPLCAGLRQSRRAKQGGKQPGRLESCKAFNASPLHVNEPVTKLGAGACHKCVREGAKRAFAHAKRTLRAAQQPSAARARAPARPEAALRARSRQLPATQAACLRAAQANGTRTRNQTATPTHLQTEGPRNVVAGSLHTEGVRCRSLWLPQRSLGHTSAVPRLCAHLAERASFQYTLLP
eukprot:3810991-Pleurochrysis_carterae.AAC.1